MSKRTKKQKEAAEGKSQEDIVPTENDKAAPPTVTYNEDEKIHSANIIK